MIPIQAMIRACSCTLNGGKIKSTVEDGKSRVFNVKKGEVSWSDADGDETQAVENFGQVLRELFVEFKD